MTEIESITAEFIVNTNRKEDAVIQLLDMEYFTSKNKANKYYYKIKRGDK